jgi:prefoldin subunit 5
MTLVRGRILGATLAAVLAIGTGCATGGDLGSRIDRLDQSVKQLESRVAAAEQSAANAERAAAAAAQKADAAAADAAASARRSEAMFNKTVRK